MAGLLELTPAREIAAGEVGSDVVEREGELAVEQGAAKAIDALCAVAVNADSEGVAPSRRAGDDDGSFGFAPALAATKLDALRHVRIMSG